MGKRLISGFFYSLVSPTEQNAHLNEPIKPIPLEHMLDPRKVRLGEKLFFDPRISKSKNLSCGHCHQLDQGGDDGLERSVTSTGEPDLTSAPTIFNVTFNFRQTWRGEFRSLEEQVQADLQNPRHANINWPEILQTLGDDPDYVTQVENNYKKGISRENVLNEFATFERSLITPDAPFAYLKDLPVNFLEIVGSFVRNMVDDPIDRAMIEAISRIGQVMGMQTIAEFVENGEILSLLKDIKVDFAQGFGIAKPKSIEYLGGKKLDVINE